MFRQTLGDAEAAGAHVWAEPGVELRERESDDGGAALEIAGAAGTSARAMPLSQPTFTDADRARLVLRAEGATQGAPVQLEVSFFDDNADNRFWGAFEITQSDWHTLDVPLWALRYERGIVPRWEDSSAWGLTFRTDAVLEVESFELWQDAAQPTPHVTIADLHASFADPGMVRLARAGSFVVMTDEPALDLQAVLRALTHMYTRTMSRFPNLPDPQGDVPLLIFASEPAYREFWRGFAAKFGSRGGPREEDEGYTWLGIATSWYSSRYGQVRPLYVHEASHALLERSMGLAAQRSWLFEGIGNHEQLAVSRQQMARVYREGLARSDIKTPIYELVNGEAIDTSRYWQATLLLEWILADPGRTAALGSAMDEMRRRGSADLRPLLARHFGLDVPRFSAMFWAWAWRNYARTPGS